MPRILRLLFGAARAFMQDNCLSFAAAIAYWGLFSILPLVLAVSSVLSWFAHSPAQREKAIDALFVLLGHSLGRDALQTQVDTIVRHGVSLSVVGLVLAIFSASSVFAAVRQGIAAVWQKTGDRPFLLGKALDLAVVLIVGALLILSLIASAVLTALQSDSGQIFAIEIGAAARLGIAAGYVVVPPAISFVAFLLVYSIVPPAVLRWRQIWPGALVAAILFQLAQLGFGIYVANFAHYDRIYGSLGAVIALLTFMYFSGAILLFGAELVRVSSSQPVHRAR